MSLLWTTLIFKSGEKDRNDRKMFRLVEKAVKKLKVFYCDKSRHQMFYCSHKKIIASKKQQISVNTSSQEKARVNISTRQGVTWRRSWQMLRRRERRKVCHNWFESLLSLFIFYGLNNILITLMEKTCWSSKGRSKF